MNRSSLAGVPPDVAAGRGRRCSRHPSAFAGSPSPGRARASWRLVSAARPTALRRPVPPVITLGTEGKGNTVTSSHDGTGGGDAPRLPANAVRMQAGDKVAIRLPASEVMMHMRLAGRLMLVELTPSGGAQVQNPDNSPVSSPVLASEAGIYTWADGAFYTYPEAVACRVHRTAQPPAPDRARAARRYPAQAPGTGPARARNPRAGGLR